MALVFVPSRTEYMYICNAYCKICVCIKTWHCYSCFYLKENVLFNDALNTFYLRLYGIRHMVKDHSDSEKGNPLPPHRLLFPINSKGSFICTIPDRIAHTTVFITPVVEHWLEREIAQWVHPMKDRSDDPLHHEQTLLPRSYISLPGRKDIFYLMMYSTHFIYGYRVKDHSGNERGDPLTKGQNKLFYNIINIQPENKNGCRQKTFFGSIWWMVYLW